MLCHFLKFLSSWGYSCYTNSNHLKIKKEVNTSYTFLTSSKQKYQEEICIKIFYDLLAKIYKECKNLKILCILNTMVFISFFYRKHINVKTCFGDLSTTNVCVTTVEQYDLRANK